MIVYYGKEVQYDSNFFHKHRTNIEEIKIGTNSFTKDNTQKIIVKPEDKLEIHFISSVTSLESFFDRLFDDNAEYITYVDLTNFDATSVTSTKNMFYECLSLESVTFSEFNYKLSDTQSMFDFCESLETINLSRLNMSSVTNTMYMFFDCLSMETLLMQNADLGKVEKATGMFFDLKALEYIDLKGATITDSVNEEIAKDLNTKNSLVVCQSEGTEGGYIKNEEFKHICSNYDIQTHICERTSNYIIMEMKPIMKMASTIIIEKV